MKKQKEKITDASAIGRQLGGNIIGYTIIFALIAIGAVYALSISVFPRIFTSKVPTTTDYSSFVKYFNNTLIISVISTIISSVGIFLAHKISFNSLKKKTIIYKNNVGKVKTTAMVIVGVYLLTVLVNTISSVSDTTKDYSNRKEALNSIVETFEEINPDELTSLELYFLGYDDAEEFKNKSKSIVENLKKTDSIISLLIIENVVDSILFIGIGVLMLLVMPKKIAALAVDEPSFENDLYGNVVSDFTQNPTPNTFNPEQTYSDNPPINFNL